jgi:hypothetical protein
VIVAFVQEFAIGDVRIQVVVVNTIVFGAVVGSCRNNFRYGGLAVKNFFDGPAV